MKVFAANQVLDARGDLEGVSLELVLRKRQSGRGSESGFRPNGLKIEIIEDKQSQKGANMSSQGQLYSCDIPSIKMVTDIGEFIKVFLKQATKQVVLFVLKKSDWPVFNSMKVLEQQNNHFDIFAICPPKKSDMLKFSDIGEPSVVIFYHKNKTEKIEF